MNQYQHGRAITLGLAFACILVPGLVAAQPEEIPARGPISFSAFDKNGDGAISEAEFGEAREKRIAARAAGQRPMRGAPNGPSFAEFDANGDGSLTPDELAAGQRAQMERRQRGAKGRGPGAGRGKRPGGQKPSFGDYDLDADGVIVEQEFHEARAKRIGERVKQGYQMRKLGNAPAFSDLDSDGDGKVSAAEFAAHQAERQQSRQNK